MSTIKVFPKSRVCVIDAHPAFEEGLRKAIEFSKKHDIHLNTTDGKKVIFGFCLEYIEQAYKAVKSQYPKVMCMGSEAKNEKLRNFIDNHFDTIMKHVSYPYCGKIKLTSPDLESAAANSLKQIKTKRSVSGFITKLKLKHQ
jgi:hypothetical protein